MPKTRHLLLLIVPVVLGLTTYLALASPAPHRTTFAPAVPTAAPSLCQAGVAKSVNPGTVSLGQPVEASLAVSTTCQMRQLPVDLIIIADESLSMTKNTLDPGAGGGKGTGTPTPGPIGTPGPPGPGPTSIRPGDEPAFCKADVGGGLATPSPTPRRPPRRTPTPGALEPTDVPQEAAGEEDLLKAEKDWVKDFLRQDEIQRDLNSDRLRIGFTSFAEDVRQRLSLTNQDSSVSGAATRMRGYDLTHVNTGLKEADRLINGNNKHVDAERIKVYILLSDFDFCVKDMRNGHAGDTTVITVAFGRDYKLRNAIQMATDRKYALEKKDMAALIELYERELAPPRAVTIKQMTVRDQLADNMQLVPGSVKPPTVTITGQLLEWQVDKLPANFSYQVEPQEVGILPISVSAEAAWTDSEGWVGKAPFPDVNVEVIAYTETPTLTPTSTATPTDTPTPTATSTSTPTATPKPKPNYLPILYRLWPEPTATPTPKVCVPEEQTIDVALIVDTSDSMQLPTQPGGQAKMDAAVQAALEIVQLLKPNDQATIIGFNSKATMTSGLSGDKAKLTAAVQALPGTHGTGTAIDSGILMASDELQSSRHVVNNTQSMILVTDGAQTVGTTQQVIDAANVAKAAGITVVTVGLGANIDEPLLKAVASTPDLYFPAPNAEDLVQIYREIARLIPCP
jgi:hypothetical protein